MEKFFDNSEFDNVDGEALTEEEAMCEEHYVRTHRRMEDGRFMVKIPFKNAIEKPSW